jgi:hypothetical protein
VRAQTLVATLGEVGDVVFERDREPRTGLGPGHAFDLHRLALRAAHTTDVVAQGEFHAGDVEMAPASPVISIVAWALTPAFGASRAIPGRSYIDHQAFLVKRHVADTGAGQT